MLNEKEVEGLKKWGRKFFSEAGQDYMTFDFHSEIDRNISVPENKTILRTKIRMFINDYSMANADKLKRKEAEIMPKEEHTEYIETEIKKTETEIQLRLDNEISQITRDSKQLEKLYHYPIQYIEMVASKKAKGLLLYGETSLGKSHRVKEVLKRLGIKDYVFVSGHITPMKFFSKMYQAKDKLVIFDDVDILSNLIILNMIKAGLNDNSGNVVEYHTTKKMDIPSSFIFNGQMIILLNEIPSQNEHLKAIESRVITYHLKFTREEKIKIIFEIAHKKEIEGTTLDERLEIARWIRENTNLSTENFNIRLYLQAIDFYKWNKSNWKELTFQQIRNDEFVELIITGVTNDDWKEKTGLSVSTKDRIRRKLGLTRGYNIANSSIRH